MNKKKRNKLPLRSFLSFLMNQKNKRTWKESVIVWICLFVRSFISPILKPVLIWLFQPMHQRSCNPVIGLNFGLIINTSFTWKLYNSHDSCSNFSEVSLARIWLSCRKENWLGPIVLPVKFPVIELYSGLSSTQTSYGITTHGVATIFQNQFWLTLDRFVEKKTGQ